MRIRSFDMRDGVRTRRKGKERSRKSLYEKTARNGHIVYTWQAVNFCYFLLVLTTIIYIYLTL